MQWLSARLRSCTGPLIGLCYSLTLKHQFNHHHLVEALFPTSVDSHSAKASIAIRLQDPTQSSEFWGVNMDSVRGRHKTPRTSISQSDFANGPWWEWAICHLDDTKHKDILRFHQSHSSMAQTIFLIIHIICDRLKELWDFLKCCPNPTMNQSYIPQCTILWQKCAHVCTFLLQNGALRNACLVHYGICEMSDVIWSTWDIRKLSMKRELLKNIAQTKVLDQFILDPN